MLDLYLFTVTFFSGYFCALIPEAIEDDDPWYTTPVLCLITATAAVFWPVTFTALIGIKLYRRHRKEG